MKWLGFVCCFLAHGNLTINQVDTAAPEHSHWVNGVIAKEGACSRFDSETYQIIRTVLDKYHRSFTLADLNAGEGLFGFRIVFEYPATCILFSHKKISKCKRSKMGNVLYSLCERNSKSKRLIALDAFVDKSQLANMAQCEHFDVVLALNSLHMYGALWREVADELLKLGENIIIQIPQSFSVPDEYVRKLCEDIESYLGENGALVLGTVRDCKDERLLHSIYLINRVKLSVEKNSWDYYFSGTASHLIVSNYYMKVIFKNGALRQWYPGINVMTYRALNGIFPTYEKIYDQFRLLAPRIPKGKSMILQGSKLRVLR